MTGKLWNSGALVDFATVLFEKAGLDTEKASTIAAALVEADMMGHTTHGMQLCAPYLKALKDGTMRHEGSHRNPERSRGSRDMGRSPPAGCLADCPCPSTPPSSAPKLYGTASIAIRRSHHIACLAVFLERATREACMVQISCSDPAVASVAPYGGTEPLFTPDPIAVGIPTSADPILIDTSASITHQRHDRTPAWREGKKLPGMWLQDSDGTASDDPEVLFTDPPGTTSTAHRRAGIRAQGIWPGTDDRGIDPGACRTWPRRPGGRWWGASVHVQVWDPTAFSGKDAFNRQIDHIVSRCLANRPISENAPVRLPGQNAIRKRKASLENGVQLYPGIMEALQPWSQAYGVTPPVAATRP